MMPKLSMQLMLPVAPLCRWFGRLGWFSVLLLLVGGMFVIQMAREPYFRLPLELRIDAVSDSAQQVRLQWDIGSGFNDAASRVFRLGPKVTAKASGKLRLTSTMVAGGLGAAIVLKGLRCKRSDQWSAIDFIAAVASSDGTRDGSLRLPDTGLSIDVDCDAVEAVVAADAGPVRLDVKLNDRLVRSIGFSKRSLRDETIRIEGIAHAPNAFSEVMQLPRLSLSSLRISSVDGDPLVVKKVQISGLGGLEMANVSVDGKGDHIVIDTRGFDQLKFSPALVVFRLVGAALIAFLGYIIVYPIRKFISPIELTGDADDFIVGAGYRAVFWCIFGTAIAWYSLWIAGQWPGFPTWDTYDQLLCLYSLEFGNWQPFVHTLFLTTLYDYFGGIGIVTILQSVLTALLMAFCFARFSQIARDRRISIVFAILFLLSPVPVVYNLQPWRDVLFALLVIFWTYVLFEILVAKIYHERPIIITWPIATNLGIALFALATVRHNGLIYVVLIPIILAVMRPISLRETGRIVMVALISYGSVSVYLGRVFNVTANTNYGLMRYTLIINPLTAIVGNSYGFRSADPIGDTAALNEFVDMEAVKKVYSPLSANGALQIAIKKPYDSPEFQKFQAAFLRLAFQNIQILMAERTHMFFATLGFRNWTWGSSLWQPNRPYFDAPQGAQYDVLRHFDWAPLTMAPVSWQKKILTAIDNPPAYLAGWVLYFTAVIPFLMSLGLVCFWRVFPVSATTNLLLIGQCAALFVTNVAYDFRYFYFLYLYGFLLVPMAAAEWRVRNAPQSGAPIEVGDTKQVFG